MFVIRIAKTGINKIRRVDWSTRNLRLERTRRDLSTSSSLLRTLDIEPLGAEHKRTIPHGPAHNAGNIMSYYDIDAILTDAQKLPCTFELEIPGLGYLDGNEGGSVIHDRAPI